MNVPAFSVAPYNAAEISGIGAEPSVVAVIEDDTDTRLLVSELLLEIGFVVRPYSGALDYLQNPPEKEPSCIVLDVRLPGMSGLDLQERLSQMQSRSLIVFMTAFADVSMGVGAMKSGAFDFLQKPFREQELLDTICRADLEFKRRSQETYIVVAMEERLRSLTTREREVLSGVLDGLLNKQIAGNLGISEIMVKIHRRGLMRKMQAKTVAHLIKNIAVHPAFRGENFQLPVETA